MNERLRRYYTTYDADHQHPMCKLSHWIGIPLILFATYAALDWIRLVEFPGGYALSFGHLWYVGALVWYCTLSLKSASLMAGIGVGIFAAAPYVPWQLVVALWLVGWITQLAGHLVWEKRRPSFFANYAQMYIGPIFYLSLLLGDWPRKGDDLLLPVEPNDPAGDLGRGEPV
jgi:uncharacterized membrane protein YGL010W